MKTRNTNRFLTTALIITAGLGLLAAPAHAITPVDLELSLLVDVSSSVDSDEFTLQKQGYANAFNNAVIQTAIANGTIGSVAVNMVMWSSANPANQEEVVSWTLISDVTSAQAFANAILAVPRPFFGTTGPGTAINCVVNGGCVNQSDDVTAISTFASNDFDGTRKVIDVSGDGAQNTGADTKTASNNAASNGITINGLAIGNQTLVDWYTDNVITGDGFVVAAADFDSFGTAVLEKIQAEIIEPNPEPEPEPEPEPQPEPNPGPTVVPEPSTMGLLAFGLGALKLRRMKKKA
ncbi:MAG: DUF1194 domain-containing protein [Candidatus Omnitrophica bacterium]|nr:DUF1194 domain-containing protein [Candidatus Omnitrophota bacterium]